ncbi:MAG: T9SS type A sorting domain-containing protein [Bacteroidia bacterium]
MKNLSIIIVLLLALYTKGQNPDFTYNVSDLTVTFTNTSTLPSGNPDSLYYEWQINGPGEFVNGTNRFSVNPSYRFFTAGNQYTATLQIQQSVRMGNTPDSVFTNTIATKSVILNLNTSALYSISGTVSYNNAAITNGSVFLLKQTPGGFTKVRNFDLANGNFSFTGLANDTFFLWAINFDTSTVELKSAIPTYSGNTPIPSLATPVIVNGSDVSNVFILLQNSSNSNGSLRITGSFNQNPGNDVSLVLLNNNKRNFIKHKRFNKNQNTNTFFENLTAGNYTLYPIIDGVSYSSLQIELNSDKEIAINLGTTTSIATITNFENYIRIYPNPSSQFINLEFNDVLIETISIISTTGQTCLTIKKPTNGLLDISSLKNGVYVMQVKTDKGFYNKRLVVE